MTDIAIRCDGLSKQYRIGERESYKALRDVLTDAATAPFRRVRSALDRRQTTDDGRQNGHPSTVAGPASFWALSDVSFEVKRGEVVGIIGRNGAGKSTLLKILSRITKPTRGHAKIHGRVGSLLEVGTGFHPELTGRENIYLNAAILGMRKAEVAKRFDEIVAFAEVEKFIDTPVKRYSSGMYVRLAFAVAAHLEPEILIIDEVLAVGDAQFQKKCLGKIGEVAHGGRTVLFVSHNMEAILRLCNKAVLLESGAIAAQGETAEIVGAYLRTGASQMETVNLTKAVRGMPVHGKVELRSVRLTPPKEYGSWKLPFGERISFEVEIEAKEEAQQIELGVALKSGRGFEIASCLSSHSLERSTLEPGRYKYSVEYPELRLVPGIYSFGLGIRAESGFEDYIADAFDIEIIPSELSASYRADSFLGVVVPQANFQLVPIASQMTHPRVA